MISNWCWWHRRTIANDHFYDSFESTTRVRLMFIYRIAYASSYRFFFCLLDAWENKPIDEINHHCHFVFSSITDKIWTGGLFRWTKGSDESSMSLNTRHVYVWLPFVDRFALLQFFCCFYFCLIQHFTKIKRRLIQPVDNLMRLIRIVAVFYSTLFQVLIRSSLAQI